MKNLTIFLFALAMLFLAPYAMAQPTLTAAGNPQVGDAITLYKLVSPSSTSTYIDEGPMGEAVTWDFAGLEVNDMVVPNPITYEFEIPSAAEAAICPSADLSLKNTYNISIVGLYDLSSAGFLKVGDSPFSNTTQYDDARDELIYPFSYGDAHSDTYSYAYEAFGVASDVSGTVDMVADGYGTLILPFETINNALRVKVIEYNNENNELFQAENTTHIYRWYKEGHAYPVLELAQAYFANVFSHTLYCHYAETPSHVSEPITIGKPVGYLNHADLLADFIVHLNPVGGMLDRLEYNLQKSAMVKLTVYDLMGKKISVIDLGAQSEGEHTHTLELGNIPKGVYLIEINADGIRQTQKVMIR